MTVAVSLSDRPTVAEAGCWLVLIAGCSTLTGSAVAPLVTLLLLESPLKVATQ